MSSNEEKLGHPKARIPISLVVISAVFIILLGCLSIYAIVNAKPNAAYVGWWYNTIGEHERAIVAYRSALQQGSNAVDAHLGIGYALAELVRYDEAYEEFKRAERANPKTPLEKGLIYYNYACYYAVTHDTDSAVKYLKRAYALAPELLDDVADDKSLENIRNDSRYISLVEQSTNR